VNKVGRFTSTPELRNVLGRPTSIPFEKILNGGKVLICDLSLGKLGRGPAGLIGTFIMSGLANAASQRGPNARDFFIYADECRHFITDTFGDILSEARKWRLGLTLASQYAQQLPEHLQHAIFGNVGTIIAFQSGAVSAKLIAPEIGAMCM
jgi:hypothetical protein